VTCARPAPALPGDSPEKMALARPTGLERADAIKIRIPIEGANHDLTALGA
jgi:hypothetical protein